jgi:hypothetical protein
MIPKRLVTALLLLLPYGAFAQAIGFTAALPKWSALNHIIERYNASRPWLDNELNEIHYLPGITFSMGVHQWDARVSMDVFKFSFTRQTVKAKENDQTRHLRVKYSTFSIIGGQFYPVLKNNFRMGLGAYPVELNYFKVKGKTSTENKWETYYTDTRFFGLTNLASSTFHLDLDLKLNDDAHLKARLYYQWCWFKDEEILPINRELNPNTYNDTYQSLTLDNSHIGFSLIYELHD